MSGLSGASQFVETRSGKRLYKIEVLRRHTCPAKYLSKINNILDAANLGGELTRSRSPLMVVECPHENRCLGILKKLPYANRTRARSPINFLERYGRRLSPRLHPSVI